MTGTKTEMAFIKFTRAEFEDMVMREIKSRYPFLTDDKRWEWEDVSLSKDVFSPDTSNDKIVLELFYTKREEPLPVTVDSHPSVVYVRVNEVCR